MTRSRFSGVLACVALLTMLPTFQAVTAQTRNPACGQDSVLVWPISRTGPLPESKVVAYGLDSEVRARFPIQRPLEAGHTSVPGRAIVTHHEEAASVVDIMTGSVTPLDIEGGGGPLTLGGPPFGTSIPPESTFVLISPTWEQFYLVDLAAQESHHLNAAVEPADIWSVSISPDDQHIAVSDVSSLFVGRTANLVHLTLVEGIASIWGSAFSPDNASLVFLSTDYATDITRLGKVDLSTFQESTIEEYPNSPSGFGIPLVFVNPSSVAYSIGGSIVVTDVNTGVSATYHTDASEPHIAATSPNGDQILYSFGTNSGESEDGPIEWFLLDLKTGESRHLDNLDGYQKIDAQTRAEWLLFQSGESVNPDMALLELETAETTLAFPGDEFPGVEWPLWQVRDGTASVFGANEGGRHSIWLLDYKTGLRSKISDINEGSHLALSPDGCTIAVGDYQPTPDLRSAEITVMSLDGNVETVIPDAVLVGWAPAG